MRATDGLNLAVNQTGALADAGHVCNGGLYKILASGTLGATPALQFQDPNGDWVAVGAAIAAGSQDVYLPPGPVRANLASGASGAYVYALRVPFE